MHKRLRINREALYLGCLTLAAAILLVLFVETLPTPEPHFASAHEATVPPLMGFTADHLVNSGSAEALDDLPGVGEVISVRMTETREVLGGYRLPGDLLLVKGIGEKTLAKIMEMLNDSLTVLNELD